MNRTMEKKGRDCMLKKTHGRKITYFCERTSMSFNEDAQVCKFNLDKNFCSSSKRKDIKERKN